MSIEPMTFVNILGEISFLDSCILKLLNFKMFHIEKVKESWNKETFKNLNEQNPYNEQLNKIKKVLQILDIKIKDESFDNLEIVKQKDSFLDFSYENVCDIENKIINLTNNIKSYENSLNLLAHMKNLNVNLRELLKTDYVDIHFGKLPIENYLKLNSLQNEEFFFIKQDMEEGFYWGFCIAPKLEAKKASKLFKELLFIEYPLPKDIKQSPEIAFENITSKIKELKINLINLEDTKIKFKNQYMKNLKETFFRFKILNDMFNYRKFAVASEKQFNICGFIPTKYIDYFKKTFEKDEKIVFEFKESRKDDEYSPPVKLKTCRLFKPFEMYVTTYGTPQYESINPSSFIGFIYSLVFGIMFGDLGQGFVLLLAGTVAWKMKKNKLGLILTRCGFSSMIFGFLFDSIFGFEGLLKNFWSRLHLTKFLPFHLLKPSNSIPILVASCLLGMFLILISISINIFLNLKNKEVGEAFFSHNGLAGLICYGSCTAAVLSLIFLKRNIFSLKFIIPLVVFPLLVIFFSIPLSRLFEKKSNKNRIEKEKFSFSSAIFDMIDILLSYFTNTLSFLRIGGLALSHAALMLVVMKFAKMAAALNVVGPVANVLVIILGNAFVVLLEGLIVSIQALRLVYYEIFSRFFQPNGKSFKPIKINFEN